MPAAHPVLVALRRPKLLVRAARAGLRLYARDKDLAPLAPTADPARDPEGVVRTLARIEAECEAARRARRADYSPGRHVSVLAALLAEAGSRAAGLA